MSTESEQSQAKQLRVHILIDRHLYQKLWEITSRRYDKPGRKLYLIVNEALREYVEKHQ